MKVHFSFIVTTLMLICCSYTADAGFAVRKQTGKTISAAAMAGSYTTSTNEHLQVTPNYLLQDEEHHPRRRRCSANGWEGTVAMWCGIGSIWMPPALILAIIFGALGLGEGHRHRGRATAGLVIGIAGIFLIAMAVTLSAVM